ncbi:amidohydrolase family protein [Nesterenkonia cremea]|uniref:amidohydrolase family protein n=1 Tax=Nesterenkonia cremea TaxID=1882340 RepID=UPI00166D4851|nr:amidohydrolase family protein [Nesterenkonia cremea]
MCAIVTRPRILRLLGWTESLGTPVHLHPSTPISGLFSRYHERGRDGSVFGFGADRGLHLLRLIASGAFERFPELTLVVGPLGEALPFWINRIDYMHGKQIATGRYPHMKPLPMKPSEYLRRNVWVTTSGLPWTEDVMYVRQKMGADRVMYAMDYPHQYEPAEVAEQDALPISGEEKFEFFEGIATRVFDLDLPPATS